MRRFGKWLIRGEGRKIREILGREPIYPGAWYTPWYLGHFCGNAVLVGFYVPAIIWIIWLVER